MGLATERVRALLFDWDGTLVDSFAPGYAAFAQVFAKFKVDFDRSRFFEHYSPNWYLFYERMGLASMHWEEADLLWRSLYDQSTPSLVPGAFEVLQALDRRGYGLGVVTSGHQRRVERELIHNAVQDCFDVFVYGDQVESKKPAPEALFRAAASLRTPPQHCVYVGDAPEDMEMGRRAGAQTVAVYSSYVRDLEALSLQADHTLRSISEMAELFATSNP